MDKVPQVPADEAAVAPPPASGPPEDSQVQLAARTPTPTLTLTPTPTLTLPLPVPLSLTLTLTPSPSRVQVQLAGFVTALVVTAFHSANPSYESLAKVDDLASLVPVPKALQMLLVKVRPMRPTRPTRPTRVPRVYCDAHCDTHCGTHCDAHCSR